MRPDSRFFMVLRCPGADDPTALEDFKCDADKDGRVTKESYLFAVFQLCDLWTETVDVEEYVEFLENGFTRVFGDLIEGDKARLPEAWTGGLEVRDEDDEPLFQTSPAAWASKDLKVFYRAPTGCFTITSIFEC